MSVIETARMILTPATTADGADFIALEHDPEVMRYLNGGKPVDRSLTDPNIGFFMPTGAEDNLWTARDKDDGSFIGWFVLWPEDETLAELGYRLRSSAWGRGLATEAARALVDWGFANRAYRSVIATTMTVNRGSRGVMEKIGMTLLRTDMQEWAEPIPGSEQGEVWYELTRADWAARR